MITKSLIIVGITAALTLTGCASQEKAKTPVPVASESAAPEVIDILPGHPIVGGSGEASPAPVVMSDDETDKDHNPEPAVGSVVSGNLPAGVSIPASSDYFAPASKIDGYNSFIALEFDSGWEKATATLRASMEAGGWTCYECLPFVPLEKTSKYTNLIKYLMNMEKDGHKVTITMAERLKGSGTVASLTFQG